jgi:hypothetical protein
LLKKEKNSLQQTRAEDYSIFAANLSSENFGSGLESPAKIDYKD